jgi:hypothetical protein
VKSKHENDKKEIEPNILSKMPNYPFIISGYFDDKHLQKGLLWLSSQHNNFQLAPNR